MVNLKKMWKNKEEISSGTSNLKEKIMAMPMPEHVAIIMDGNGRWAKKRALPRVAGHHEGMKVVRKITKLSSELGIKTLTLYAFSTENWKRPKIEVDYLLKLPEEFLGTFLPELIEENVRVQVMGNKEALPPHTLFAVEKAVQETKGNNGMVLNFALNYGGRDEIIKAVRKVVNDANDGKIAADEINEDLFSDYLMSTGLQDPDLLIRTSGEIRLSNFMLWQLAYSEFWFTEVLWPDFDEEQLMTAISDFQSRGRRFGGI